MSLSITTRRLAGDVVEIAPRGEIDLDTAYEVRDAVAATLSSVAAGGPKPSEIRLNLRLVSFIDSVGISALVASFQTAQVSGVTLVISQPSRFVHRQLWVTGLLGLFGAPQPAAGDEAHAGPGAR